jgi:thymidylate synthase (FAD)
LHRIAREVYEQRLNSGVAREQARKDLPLATYTEAYWKIDLHNLLQFLWLPMAQAAQYEIRCYAEIVGNEIVRRWCPIAWEAFKDYRLDAMSLSRREIEVVRRLQSGDVVGACDTARGFGWLEMGKDGYARNRERQELEEKLLALGFSVPWS